ncbi:MAG: MFS transporter [Leptospirales bacterium]
MLLFYFWVSMKPDVDHARAASSGPISRKLLFFYGLPMTGASMLNFLTGTYLMKYATDVLFIGSLTMGMIFLGARIWDAINDPICGYLSDHTTSRMGRRRLWIAASAIPTGVLFYFLWTPAENYKILWMIIAIPVFYTALTAFYIPHYSLGAELSADYHDRNRIYGNRALWENIGNFLGVAVLQMVIFEPGSGATAKEVTPWVMGGVGIFTIAVIWIMVLKTPRGQDQTSAKHGIFKTYGAVLKNRQARSILIVGFFSQVGGAIILTATFYYTEYILNAPGSEAIVIGLFMLAATLSIPGWIFIAKRVDKLKLWMGANITAALIFIFTMYLSAGDVVQMAILATIAGVAAGAIIMINPAALADTISSDGVQENQSREGTYFALYTFINKSAMGFSAALLGVVLWWGGYIANVEQTYESALAIRTLYAFGPAVAFSIAAVFLYRYMRLKKN